MDYLKLVVQYKRRLGRIGLCQHRLRRTAGIRPLNTGFYRILHKEIQKSTTRVKMEPPWNVMFFGTDEFALESLAALNKGKERGLIGKLEVVTAALKKTSPVQRYCKEENLKINYWPVEVPPGIFDVGTVVSFGHLLPSRIINAFPWGILNVHGSLLPRWRGAAPIIHAVLNNDRVTGVTVMEIQPYRFDVGRVVSNATIQISWDTKSGVLTKHLATVGAKELIGVMENLPAQLEKATEQTSGGVTKAPKVNAATARIQWNLHTCRDIQARYRALDDHFPLWTTWQGTPVKLREMVMHREWSSPIESEGVVEEIAVLEKQKHYQHFETNGLNSEKENNSRRENNCEYSIETNYKDNIKNISNLKDARTLMSASTDGNNASKEVCLNEIIKNKPGSIVYNKKLRTLSVRCVDDWVTFCQVVMKKHKAMSAHEFYNGFIGKVSNDLRVFI